MSTKPQATHHLHPRTKKRLGPDGLPAPEVIRRAQCPEHRRWTSAFLWQTPEGSWVFECPAFKPKLTWLTHEKPYDAHWFLATPPLEPLDLAPPPTSRSV